MHHHDATPPATPGISRPVLLVDDCADTLEMYRIGLTMAGFEPLVASGVADLREFEKEQPVAVVADLGAGSRRDAWQVIEEIRNAPWTRATPLVVLTVRLDVVSEAHARRASAALVLKPCLPDELARIVQFVTTAVAPRTSGAEVRRQERRRRRRGDPGGEPQRVSLERMILGTYREMPGLVLSLNQAARLFGLRKETCGILLEDLVSTRRLRRSADGRYSATEAVR